MQEKALNKYSAKNEIEGCLLCYDAPCTKGCSHGLDPAKVIRSLRFKNLSGELQKRQKHINVAMAVQKKNAW